MNTIKPLGIVLFFLISLASCQTAKQIHQTTEVDQSKNFGNDNTDQIKRKIITSVNLRLQVQNADSANHQIKKVLKNLGGYAAEMGTDQTIIRVNAEFLELLLTEISGIGTIKEKNIFGVDVTDEFLDNGIRLENAEKSRDKYLELLKKAETVEEILKVEKELERLNETIDIIKGRMNRLEHLSDFATITINLEEKKKPGLIGYVFVGAYKSIRWLFVRN